MLDNSKKQKILEASLEEFSEYGYEKANTDRISKKAGVSKGLIFHHFGSKENLFIITINKCIDDILFEFNDINILGEDFISIIMKLMQTKYEFFIKNPMHYKLIINGFYNTPKKLKAQLQQRYSEIKQIGFDIIVDIIKGLPLKKDVSIDHIVSVIAVITNVVESKYLHYFTEESFEKFYDAVKNEYIELMNIVLYGIIDSYE
jgi:TetR/AcrR family transcriptional regulator